MVEIHTLLSLISTNEKLIEVANSFYNNHNIKKESLIHIIGTMCKNYNIKKLYFPKK
jgi:hypothetical protein